MWGSAFSDLAKKVEEQASSAFSTTNMFNLDAMQEGQANEQKEQDSTKKSTSVSAPPNQPLRSTEPASKTDSQIARQQHGGLQKDRPTKEKTTDSKGFFFSNQDWDNHDKNQSKTTPPLPPKPPQPLWNDPVKPTKMPPRRVLKTPVRKASEKKKQEGKLLSDNTTADTSSTSAAETDAVIGSKDVVAGTKTGQLEKPTRQAQTHEENVSLPPQTTTSNAHSSSAAVAALSLLEQVQAEMKGPTTSNEHLLTTNESAGNKKVVKSEQNQAKQSSKTPLRNNRQQPENLKIATESTAEDGAFMDNADDSSRPLIVTDGSIELLSPDVSKAVTRISETSAEMDHVLELYGNSQHTPASDNGSITMELHNLANSERALTEELLMEEQERANHAEKLTTRTSENDENQQENDKVVTAALETSEPPVVNRDILDKKEHHRDFVTRKLEEVQHGGTDELDKEPTKIDGGGENLDVDNVTEATQSSHPPVATDTDKVNSDKSKNEQQLQSAVEADASGNKGPVEMDGGNESIGVKNVTEMTRRDRPEPSAVAEGDEKVNSDKSDGDQPLQSVVERDEKEEKAEEVPARGASEVAIHSRDVNHEQKEAPSQTPESLSDNVMGMFSNPLQMMSPFGAEVAPQTEKERSSPIQKKEEADRPASDQDSTKPPPPIETPAQGNISEESSLTGGNGDVPEHIIEMYSSQIQRLEDHHASELKEMEQRHALELAAASNHDDCGATIRKLEEDYRQQLSDSNDQISEILQKNEGMTLKMDVLQRELDGTKAILDKKETDLGEVNESRSRDVQKVEQQLKDVEGAASASAAEVERLKDELQSSKAEVEASNDAYTKLKARVKVVATELKERRVECRGLHANVAELTSSNESLQKQIEDMRSQLTRQDRARVESDKAMEVLRSQMNDRANELAASEKKLRERDAMGEKALASYKKKAQSALAAANARAAAANNEREEAALEASAVKDSSGAALERAKIAEQKAKEMMANAKEMITEFEEQKQLILDGAADAKDALQLTREELALVRKELHDSKLERGKLAEEVDKVGQVLRAERTKSLELGRELKDTRATSDGLQDEVETLRQELLRSVSSASMKNDPAVESGADGVSKESDLNVHEGMNGGKFMGDVSESEATIFMLQQELDEANDAIKELKEALRGSLDQSTEPSRHREDLSSPKLTNSNQASLVGSLANQEPESDSTPLFFAMEKQAELNTARNEITRLANLLGDAESAKMEAYEAMDDMRRKMEEAEARLRRQEKLGGARDTTAGAESVSRPGSAFSSQQHGESEQQPRLNGTAHTGAAASDATVNLEYLKNVMLSYLNAKTTSERKALVPVLAAVLELTPDEQAKALQTVEESGDLQGVGSAFLESLGSKVHSLM